MNGVDARIPPRHGRMATSLDGVSNIVLEDCGHGHLHVRRSARQDDTRGLVARVEETPRVGCARVIFRASRKLHDIATKGALESRTSCCCTSCSKLGDDIRDERRRHVDAAGGGADKKDDAAAQAHRRGGNKQCKRLAFSLRGVRGREIPFIRVSKL